MTKGKHSKAKHSSHKSHHHDSDSQYFDDDVDESKEEDLNETDDEAAKKKKKKKLMIVVGVVVVLVIGIVAYSFMTSDSSAVCNRPCANGGTCIGNDICACQKYFTGATCDQPNCIPSCQNGGTCSSGNTCHCNIIWKGLGCLTPACNPPCKNNGVCMEGNQCFCPTASNDTWQGDDCSKPSCSPPCEYGGVCSRGNQCICSDFSYGPRCEKVFCPRNWHHYPSLNLCIKVFTTASALTLDQAVTECPLRGEETTLFTPKNWWEFTAARLLLSGNGAVEAWLGLEYNPMTDDFLEYGSHVRISLRQDGEAAYDPNDAWVSGSRPDVQGYQCVSANVPGFKLNAKRCSLEITHYVCRMNRDRL